MPADIHDACGRRVFYDPRAGRYGHLATGTGTCPTDDMEDLVPSTWKTELILRPDGRFDVADTEAANELYGCRRDTECILQNGHAGDCDEEPA